MTLNKKAILPVLVLAAVIAVVADFAVGGAQVAGKSAAIGLIGSGLLILAGNFILRPLLQRAEDYYGGGEDDE